MKTVFSVRMCKDMRSMQKMSNWPDMITKFDFKHFTSNKHLYDTRPHDAESKDLW